MSPETGSAIPWRRVRDVAFATCTLWLVVQNAALLALHLRGHAWLGRAWFTLARASLEALSPLVTIAVAVVIGGLLAAALSRGSFGRPGGATWEKRHG